MDQRKVQFAGKAQDVATQMAQILAQMSELAETWDDRLYGPGAANAIVQSDITPGFADPLMTQGITTPDDLYAFIIACSQIGKFIESDAAAVAGPYSATFNKLRRDM